jgi:hypothetical protein
VKERKNTCGERDIAGPAQSCTSQLPHTRDVYRADLSRMLTRRRRSPRRRRGEVRSLPRTAVGSAPAAGAGAVAACVGTGTSAALAVASSSPHGDTPMRRPVGWSSKTLWKAAAARRDLCPAGGRRRVDGEQAAGGCPRRSGQQMGAPSRPVGGLRGGVSLVVVDGALAETAAAVGTAAARATLHLLVPGGPSLARR